MLEDEMSLKTRRKHDARWIGESAICSRSSPSREKGNYILLFDVNWQELAIERMAVQERAKEKEK